ncbi:Negative regulator of mitosis [Cytospora mali]|uniref:Negative regulator of mitosis n=1 Tax=Cytospora mali TaxID=578113 RepID=A0A194VEU4_CYTMA|nr:Negative regulator of mitosis [Valsa mali var. pyri (nom. inval.)]
MAWVKSLGLHPPLGIEGQPVEGTYTWDVIADDEGEDELLTVGNCVIWKKGGLFRKSFNLEIEKDEPILQALITRFPTTDTDNKGNMNNASMGKSSNGGTKVRKEKTITLAKALVVFLKTQAHIYFLSGTSHIVHMPFEVESACAAPVGVIIQRRPRTQNLAPVSLRFPRVPPSSFVSSQLSPTPHRQHSMTSSFSVEGLGQPKTLPLRLSTTMENMFQTPLETNDSHWPRLVCLTDPLLELGLVVSHIPTSAQGGRRKSPAKSPFLDLAEEILHIETVQGDLVLAITANRETNLYTIWQLTYIRNEDVFTKDRKKRKGNISRRRSSMQPRLSSGATTPVVPSFRESLGTQAQPPGKRNRKSERLEKAKSDDIAIALGEENEGEKTRRQSRRVSSLLARADLSASHERTTFAEPSIASTFAENRRATGARARQSGGSVPLNLSAAYSMNSLSNLPTPRVDDFLDELEGFPDMALDDHSFDGLTREILLTKIHSMAMDNTNVRYSLSNQPARAQAKVFVIDSPPFATDESGKRDLLIGIQDSLDKRLQLLPLCVERQSKTGTGTRNSVKLNSAGTETFRITPDVSRRAHNVVDSCKVSDGDQSLILILAENTPDQRELSIQAPWSAMSPLMLPMLYADKLGSLDYTGTHVNRKVKGRRSVGAKLSASNMTRIRHSRSSGVIDLEDRDGNVHRVQIQLQPSCPQVRKVLQICRSVLPTESSEKLMAGWWHIMKWMEDQKIDTANREWSSLVLEILSIILSLSPSTLSSPSSVLQTTPRRRRSLDPSTGTYERMLSFTAPNASSFPPWLQSHAWRWMLDEGTSAMPAGLPGPPQEDFLTSHVRLAKLYMVSTPGQAALGSTGYLPTAIHHNPDDRNKAAWGIIYGLHLWLEEEKLDVMVPEFSPLGRATIRVILCQVGRWLGWHDFVALHGLGVQADLDPRNDHDLSTLGMPDSPQLISVFDWIQSQLAGDKSLGFPTLADVYAVVTQRNVSNDDACRRWSSVMPRTFMFKKLFSSLTPTTTHVEVVELMNRCGFTADILETLPEAVLAPLKDAISMCQARPPTAWPKDLLALVHRSDIATMLKRHRPRQVLAASTAPPSHTATRDYKAICASVERAANYGHLPNESTDRQAIIHALFREDRRLIEADAMLSTRHHRVIQCNSEPHWAESEYLEKQKEQVTIVATGTLAIPAGRGLMQYGLRFPLPTEKYDIMGFNLTCLVKPTNILVNADKSLFIEEKVNWAFFHQGAAAGLQVSPQAKGIDNNWIIYNKPSGEPSNRHAGFLLALGLNGHLKSMVKWVAFKYLTTKHTMTSIGLLLGLAASFMGTMDNLITRVLTVHVTRLLPPGAAELNLSHLTQTAGLMGIGLVYCQSQHRRMSEVMMSEIEHEGDEDEEDPLRNEGYRLAAGFALGLINLGKGTDLRGLHDMRLTEKLLTLSSATKKVELVNVLDRSAAGAVIAIALIFMKSDDHIVARKVDIPDSVMQFTYIRPDILLLRTLAKNLIMWSCVQPTVEWIRSSLPKEYRWRHMLQGPRSLRSKDMPFYSILAGLLFSLGLRFAGSGNTQVRDLLVKYLDKFRDLAKQPAECYDAQLARNNVQMCQDVVALSAASVMAGTGDLEVMRRLRSLHGRDDPHTSYGSHMAAHLAIGALFLGSGTATFSTSNLAIASLLIAFYPLFPSGIQDNRAHLQAFRHFWVFAADPRCLVSKDIATGQPISVPVLIKLRAPAPLPTKQASPSKSRHRARHSLAPQQKVPMIIRKYTPCLLPPFEEISTVRTDATAQGYWNLELDFEQRPELVAEFRKNQTLHLRQRPLHESIFGATLRALGRDGLTDKSSNTIFSGDASSSSTGSRDPLEWIFNQPALIGLTHAERSMVLDRSGGEGGSEEAATTEVDALLTLESGLDGWSKEGLEGLKLLFEWAGRRVPSSSSEEAQREEGGAEGGGWWLRDSVVEMLKGKAWLAAREEMV